MRATVTVCLLLVALRAWAGPLHLRLGNWPTSTWYGSDDFGAPRARVQEELERLPGRQLAIVRYSPAHNALDEWVYNAADMNTSKVIWAREVPGANNFELVEYYKDRTVWLVQPDKQPAIISPYAGSAEERAAAIGMGR